MIVRVEACGDVAEMCICILPQGHTSFHECDFYCGGRWLGDIDGDDFKSVRLPRLGGYNPALDNR